MPLTQQELVVLGVVGAVVIGFFGWCVYALKNPDYLARLQAAWAPKDYHTS